MTLGLRKNALVVPTNAVQISQQGQFVYVVKPDKKVEMRSVISAVTAGEDTIIEKGLAVGETVVTDGQLRLTPGAVVETEGTTQPVVGKKG
jgi:multidrug efflux system membrane fusion protein